jgi:hypothetical protein
MPTEKKPKATKRSTTRKTSPKNEPVQTSAKANEPATPAAEPAPVAGPATQPMPEQPATPVMQPAQPQYQPHMAPGALRAQPAKKSHLGLILGIIGGGVALLALIAGVLLYFFWYQNPHKVVTDGVANLVSARQASYSMGGDVTPSSTSTSGPSKTTYRVNLQYANQVAGGNGEVTMDLPQVGQITVKAEIYADREATYFRVNGIKKIYEKYIDTMVDQSMKRYSNSSMTDEEKDTARSKMREQYTKQALPIIEKIDGKWVKMTQDDMRKMSPNRTTTQQCTDAINAMYDTKARNEIAAVLRKHGDVFTVEKLNKPALDNGAVGYKVTVASPSSHEARSLSRDLGNTRVGELLRRCSDATSTRVTTRQNGRTIKTERHSAISGPDLSQTDLELWVSPFSHDVKRIVMKPTSQSSQQPVTINVNDTKVDLRKPSESIPYSELMRGSSTSKDNDSDTSSTSTGEA